MNAVFTLVAKNYFSIAKTFAKSVKLQNPDLDVYVGIADETDDLTPFLGEEYRVILAKELNIEHYEEMAFKYNVTEFCTAIKPFYFDYFFTTKNYEKVIFFDPDIFLYSTPNVIFDSLNNVSFVLTPHYTTAEVNYTGNTPETLTLFAGIYNLGFIAIKNSSNGREMIAWWKHRLQTACYVDKFEALMVDQKWIDFVPAFYSDDLLIEKNLGCNVAYWNIHERKFVTKGTEIFIENRIRPNGAVKLVFIHFSGLNPANIYSNKQCPNLNLKDYKDWIPFLEEYASKVLDNGFDHFIKLPYSYGAFTNGEAIVHFHRRLYRRLLETNQSATDPFNFRGKFYQSLQSNKLLIKEALSPDKMNERNFPDFEKKVAKLNRLMKIVKSMIGFNKYTLLLKFCQRYFRPENQGFLINNPADFINENIK